ncbi:MAG: glycosyltransferase family 2 protein [Candidatus Spechtbacterales bacterium]|nr:glycosyltransferase family 2 protein [Candidatus Spechtbacterales bacterium]
MANNKKPHLSVIFPAYNEAKRIPDTLLDVDKYLENQDYTYEILVVIDGATDNTYEVIEGHRQLVHNLRIINNEKNHGKGYVVRQGMLEAKGKWRLFMDSDGSTAIEHIEKMWPLAKEHKVIIGTRDPKDAKGAKQEVRQSLLKYILGNMGNIMIQIMAVPGIWDTQNGFKLFHEEAAEKIFSRARMNRFSFDIEALAIARKFGYKIGMIPVHWVNDPHSTVTFIGPNGYVKVLLDLFKIRWNLMTGVYDKPRKQPYEKQTKQKENKEDTS